MTRNQHGTTRHYQSKIPSIRHTSFPLVLTPHLDVIPYLYPHPPVCSHQCPFTIHSPDHESLPIKHKENCCTNPPAGLNLEGQSRFTCISNTGRFKAASHQGQLVPHLKWSQEAASTAAPLLGVPEHSQAPSRVRLPGHRRGPSGRGRP